MATAGQAAVRQMGSEMKAAARAEIARGGFSKRWQNALRVDVFPRRGKSLRAAAFMYHKIPYADVFERGDSIQGRPLLWLPLPHIPPRLGRQRMTPSLFVRRIGPLRSVRNGSRPLLAARIKMTKTDIKRGTVTKATIARLRQGASGEKPSRSIPVFHGVASVRMPDRLAIAAIARRAAADLPRLYAKNLIVD